MAVINPQALQPNPLLIAGFLLSGLAGNVATWMMVGEVNRRLPTDQRFSMWWWTFQKHVRLWKQHKALCPESSLRLWLILAFSIASICMILMVMSFQRATQGG
jgi:hypothetical protein